jgi:hypothetical protein
MTRRTTRKTDQRQPDREPVEGRRRLRHNGAEHLACDVAADRVGAWPLGASDRPADDGYGSADHEREGDRGLHASIGERGDDPANKGEYCSRQKQDQQEPSDDGDEPSHEPSLRAPRARV